MSFGFTDSARDRNPLQLTSGQLVNVPAQVLGVEAHLPQQNLHGLNALVSG
jgi:hypothetical protein